MSNIELASDLEEHLTFRKRSLIRVDITFNIELSCNELFQRDEQTKFEMKKNELHGRKFCFRAISSVTTNRR